MMKTKNTSTAGFASGLYAVSMDAPDRNAIAKAGGQDSTTTNSCRVRDSSTALNRVTYGAQHPIFISEDQGYKQEDGKLQIEIFSAMEDARSKGSHDESRGKRGNHDQNTEALALQVCPLECHRIFERFLHQLSRPRESSEAAESIRAVSQFISSETEIDYKPPLGMKSAAFANDSPTFSTARRFINSYRGPMQLGNRIVK